LSANPAQGFKVLSPSSPHCAGHTSAVWTVRWIFVFNFDRNSSIFLPLLPTTTSLIQVSVFVIDDDDSSKVQPRFIIMHAEQPGCFARRLPAPWDIWQAPLFDHPVVKQGRRTWHRCLRWSLQRSASWVLHTALPEPRTRRSKRRKELFGSKRRQTIFWPLSRIGGWFQKYRLLGGSKAWIMRSGTFSPMRRTLNISDIWRSLNHIGGFISYINIIGGCCQDYFFVSSDYIRKLQGGTLWCTGRILFGNTKVEEGARRWHGNFRERYDGTSTGN